MMISVVGKLSSDYDVDDLQEVVDGGGGEAGILS